MKSCPFPYRFTVFEQEIWLKSLKCNNNNNKMLQKSEKKKQPEIIKKVQARHQIITKTYVKVKNYQYKTVGRVPTLIPHML